LFQKLISLDVSKNKIKSEIRYLSDDLPLESLFAEKNYISSVYIDGPLKLRTLLLSNN
jgi:hypothetical protein